MIAATLALVLFGLMAVAALWSALSGLISAVRAEDWEAVVVLLIVILMVALFVAVMLGV